MADISATLKVNPAGPGTYLGASTGASTQAPVLVLNSSLAFGSYYASTAGGTTGPLVNVKETISAGTWFLIASDAGTLALGGQIPLGDFYFIPVIP